LEISNYLDFSIYNLKFVCGTELNYAIIAKNFIFLAKFLMSSRRDLPWCRIGLYKKEDSYGMTHRVMCPLFASLG
jgi:hypothetical protein